MKLVTVGSGAVGKTSLLMVYSGQDFPTNYVPTVFNNASFPIKLIDETPVSLQVYDTAGQDDYDHLRPLGYHGTDVFLVCFAINDPITFKEAARKFVPEVKRTAPHAPDNSTNAAPAQIVLVGTKADLRDDPAHVGKDNLVTSFEAKALAKRIKAVGYYECSAKTGAQVNDVFEGAIRAALQRRSQKIQPRWTYCNLL